MWEETLNRFDQKVLSLLKIPLKRYVGKRHKREKEEERMSYTAIMTKGEGQASN